MSDIERKAFELAKERFFESVEVTSQGAIVGAEEALLAIWQAARQAPASGEVEADYWLVENTFTGSETLYRSKAKADLHRCLCVEVSQHDEAKRITPLFTHPPAKVPEEWNLVEHPTCYQLHRGNEIVAVLAGPDTEANAEKLKALLTTPTPATTPETELPWQKLPGDASSHRCLVYTPSAHLEIRYRIAPAGFVKTMTEATHFIPLTPPQEQ